MPQHERNSAFIERLHLTFEHRSMAEVGRMLGVPHATIRNYYQEGRLPSAEVLIKIANTTNVSLNWLLTGRGDMYGGRVPPIGLDKSIERKIAEMIDVRLAGLIVPTGRSTNAFDLKGAVAESIAPEKIMQIWLEADGRKYPSDFGVAFFRGWEKFSSEEKIEALKDARRILDRVLSIEE
ncbi:MAG: helix-turn-helix domain-containing protein [Acidobacteria bacterium]|nr:helix-turn-helix domain-containing protein [Acidobacteriota bacterium]